MKDEEAIEKYLQDLLPNNKVIRNDRLYSIDMQDVELIVHMEDLDCTNDGTVLTSLIGYIDKSIIGSAFVGSSTAQRIIEELRKLKCAQ